MTQENVAVQEFSTARGNTLTVSVDLVGGCARVVEHGRVSREAISGAAPRADGLRFLASSAA